MTSRKDLYRERNGYPVSLYSNTKRYRNHVSCEEIYQCGSFRYRLIPDWAKFPEELWGYMVAGIATDKYDNVYIAQRCKQAPIVKFDKDGNFIKSFGEKLNFIRPHGIWIDTDLTVWFTDDGASVIWHIDQDGNLLDMLGNYGVGSDTGYDFYYVDPSDQTEPTTYMYVNEKGENVKAQVKNSAYMSIKRLGGPFNKPTRLVGLSDGRKAVSDGYGNVAIHIFDQNNKLQKTWGGPGKEPGHFSIPHGLSVDKYDRIWTCDRENERVQVFDADGNLLKILICKFMPFNTWCDGQYCYAIEGDGRISIFDLESYELVAQIGHWQCFDLIAHDFTGNSHSDLFLADLGVKSVAKLERIG